MSLNEKLGSKVLMLFRCYITKQIANNLDARMCLYQNLYSKDAFEHIAEREDTTLLLNKQTYYSLLFRFLRGKIVAPCFKALELKWEKNPHAVTFIDLYYMKADPSFLFQLERFLVF